MFEAERERGRQLVGLSETNRNERIAKMMFGEDWFKGHKALKMLMASWGVASSVDVPPDGGDDDDQS